MIAAQNKILSYCSFRSYFYH